MEALVCFIVLVLVLFTCALFFPFTQSSPPSPDPDPDPVPDPDPLDFIYNQNYYQEFTVPEGYDEDTQGRNWSNWDVNNDGIQKMAKLFNNSAGYIANNPKDELSIKAIQLWEDWIRAITTKLEDVGVLNSHWFWSESPWGSKNGRYTFLIDLPTNLAYYIVNKSTGSSTADTKLLAAKTIQGLIPEIDPIGFPELTTMGTAMLLFPWVVSHIITKDLDKTSERYLHTVSHLIPNDKLKSNEPGLHIDHAYSTSVSSFYEFDEIESIYVDLVQIVPELEEHFDKINLILKHPTIPLSGGVLYGRKDVGMGLYTGSTRTHPIALMPSARYLRYFTDEWQWCSKGGQDSSNFMGFTSSRNMGIYGILCRKMFRRGETDTSPKFPAFGFIMPEGTTGLIDIGNSCSCVGSYVFTDYETYAVSKVVDLEIPKFKGNKISETIVIDIQTQTATIIISGTPTVDPPINLDVYVPGNTKLYNGPNTGIVASIDFKNNSYPEKYYISDFSEYSLSKLTNGYFDDTPFDTTDDLAKKGQSVISKYLHPYLVTPAEGQVLNYEPFTVEGFPDNTFQFDPKMNQFMCHGYTR
ncbi:ODV-E66 [Homarus gammarus nudivirus]|uniref:ODV-E66 n=1 Tax=Homarus gammarus nudivirus TaxID=2509616 RepID=A0A411HB65_9VIRU|nr:ODV-E66 [Homarus gammarus nudivirus]QBB28629.1 ODV-E66 [Homarus gammarus nudivirus]